MSRVTLLGDSDLHWPWRNVQGGGPQYAIGNSRTLVDPFPCYAHDRELVAETLALVEAALPISAPPFVWILSHEPWERTNGWAQSETDWDDEADEWQRVAGHIVLAGKRIPPHPGVTRYLVAHEYGHHVEYALLAARGLQQHEDAVRDEYRALRKLPEQPFYGGRTWHATDGELLANDFRCLVAGVETEFWPHPGFDHPSTVPAVKKWWKKTVKELA